MTAPRFFKAERSFSAREIADLTGSELSDPVGGEARVEGIAAAADGGPGILVFVDGKANRELLSGLSGGIVLTTAELSGLVPAGVTAIVSKHPQRAFATIGRLLFPESAKPGSVTGETGISPSAHIHPDSEIEAGAIVEAGAVIGRGVIIGSGTTIAPGAVIGRDCRIGRDGYVGPGASVQFAFIGNRVFIHAGARLGSDGFGYVSGARGLEKMPQIGRVIIQDDVEIGANATVDRGTLDDTVIGEGTKIDNLVQIAHNVRIGRNCILAGMCGISGSVTIGDGAMLGGGAGIADHVTIGAGAQIAAAAGVMRDVPPGERYAGAPAKPLREFFREVAALTNLAHQAKGRNGNER